MGASNRPFRDTQTPHIPVRRSASNKYLQIDERIRSRFAHTHLRTGISRRTVIRCSPDGCGRGTRVRSVHQPRGLGGNMRPIEAPKCARLLEEIELEMKRVHVWQEAPLAPEKFIDMGAFGRNTMGLEQWLQFVFLPAVKEALAGEREPPNNSEVHIHAVRNFDGESDRDALVQLLCDFDKTYLQEVAGTRDICRAAEQGSAEAQFNLGLMYVNGQGVAKDEKTAVLWYTKAAEQGYAKAQDNLGWMYDTGRGVAKDEKTAVLWYTKAAKQGYADAQFNLGAMYADGRGVTQDIVSAHMWFYLAARAGNGSAEKHRDLTAAQMTPMQLSRAQDRAQRCINSNYKDFD